LLISINKSFNSPPGAFDAPFKNEEEFSTAQGGWFVLVGYSKMNVSNQYDMTCKFLKTFFDDI